MTDDANPLDGFRSGNVLTISGQPMTNPLTPERVQELLDGLDTLKRADDSGTYINYCTAGTVRGAVTGDGLLTIELRALCLAYQEREKTCAERDRARVIARKYRDGYLYRDINQTRTICQGCNEHQFDHDEEDEDGNNVAFPHAAHCPTREIASWPTR